MALTVDGANSFKPAKHLGLGSTPSIEFLEAATQTFKRGAPLQWASGYVSEASADDDEIIGIAETDAHNDTSAGTHVMRVIPALPGMVFSGHLGNGSGLTTDYTTLQTDIGAVYGIVKDGTNLGWLVDQDETTNVRVRVIGFQDAVGTANGRVYFIFLSYMNIDGSASAKAVSGLYGTAT